MSAPLRIALVTETWPPEVNGVAMTMSRLVSGLRERGHVIQVIRPRQHGDAATPPEGEVLVRGVPLPGYAGLQFGLPAGALLRRLWRESCPHVVHTVTEGPLGWSALRHARAMKLPVSSSYHTNFDSYSRHYGAGLLAPLVRAWLLHFHRRAACTLVPTRLLADGLTRARVPGAQVLGRGVDTALFDPRRRSLALRRSWGAGDEDPVVLHVGRLAPEKNLALAAQAFSAIAAHRPRARMVWIGDGPAKDSLARSYPQHVFAGTRKGEELAAHYASADVFLFPSLTETYGNVVAEAMASGLGVVAYATAAAGELIVAGEHGLTVPPRDEQAFVAAACRLSGDDRLLAHCRKLARRRVEPITWQSVTDDFETALRRAAAVSG